MMKPLFESWRQFNEGVACNDPLEYCYYTNKAPALDTNNNKYFHLTLQSAKELLIRVDPGYKTMLEMAPINVYRFIDSTDHIESTFKKLNKKGQETSDNIELSDDEAFNAKLPAINDKTAGAVVGTGQWRWGIDLSISTLIVLKNNIIKSKSLQNYPADQRPGLVFGYCVFDIASTIVHEIYHLSDEQDPELPFDDDENPVAGSFVGDLPRPGDSYSEEEASLNMVDRESRAFKAEGAFLNALSAAMEPGPLSRLASKLSSRAQKYKVKYDYGT